MKTNQIMLRKMGGLSVEQRTKDGMFNATKLLRQWNESHPDKQRSLDNFWKSTNLVEFMSEMAECELGLKSVDFTELKNALSKSNKGKTGGTWLLPNLFVKFAMYINPQFEYHVIRFVSDQMIAYRNEAGDAYKELAAAVAKITPKHRMQGVMSAMGRAVNIIAKGTHKKMLRNDCGDEKSQKEYVELERKIAMLINEGFISNLPQLDYYIHRLLGDKYKLPQIK